MSDWRKVYTGRDSELNELIRSWEKVKSGGGPHVHLVRGERGMGKTRLVQEFYNYLSTHEDPDNYWPDHISTDGNTLLPGPDPDADELVKSHFENFNLKERKLPFLWWGFRIADPQQRNVIRASLTEHASTLTQHLVPLTIARDIELLRKKSGTGLGKGLFHDVGADIAADILEGALKEIPGISTASTIYSVGKRINDVRKTYKKELDENKAKQNSSLSVLYDVADKDIQDSTLDQLKLLNPKASIHWDKVKEKFSQSPPRQIPAIIFIDDAQFTGLGSGSGSLAVLVRFWKWALYNNFPLLILATHWNYEWEESLGKPAPEDPEKPLSFAVGFQPRSEDDRKHFSETILGRDVDLGAILQSALPQLSADDRALILEKSDGNPMLLREFLERLTDEKLDWCDANGLTKIGQRQLQKKIFKLHELIRDRLENSTPVPIRKAILISALQGVEFIESVTLKAAEELKIDIGDDALKRASSPHAFIDFLDENKAAFIQRAVYDAALTLVDDVFEDETVVKAALGLATEILIASTSENKAQFSEAQLNQLKGFEIGYGLESDDPEIFDQSLRTLEAEITGFMEGDGHSRDYSAAAELAQKWWETVQGKQTKPLNVRWYEPAYMALLTWFGPQSVYDLAHAALKDSQKLVSELNTPGSRLDLSRSLERLGDVEQAVNGPQAARPFYAESLKIRRQLVAELNAPDARQSLAVSLERLGDVEREMSGSEAARPFYTESLEIRRQLVAEVNTSKSRRGLSISLDRLGGVERAVNGPQAAQPFYAESLEIRRQLVAEVNMLDDRQNLYVSLQNMGDVEGAVHGAEAARLFHAENLKLTRELVAELGTPKARRYLGLLLSRVGDMEFAVQGLVAAHPFYTESLEIARALASELATPEARRDLVVSLDKIGYFNKVINGPEAARPFYVKILNLTRALVAELGTLSDRMYLAVSLERFGDVEIDLKKTDSARTYYSESLEITRAMALESGTPKDRQSLARCLSKFGELELSVNKSEAARPFFTECLEITRALATEPSTPETRQDLVVALEKVGDLEQTAGNKKLAQIHYLEAFQLMNKTRKNTDLIGHHQMTYVALNKALRTESFWKWGVPKPIRVLYSNYRHGIAGDLFRKLEEMGYVSSISALKTYLNTGQLPPKKDQK